MVRKKGDIKTFKWKAEGFLGGFSSPIVDGDRVYQIENGSKMIAFDVVTGKELWKQQLGTVQKAHSGAGRWKSFMSAIGEREIFHP